MGSAQKISELVLSEFAMHNSCAPNNRVAQNNQLSVRFAGALHKHCAFELAKAQNLSVFGLLRETEEKCN